MGKKKGKTLTAVALSVAGFGSVAAGYALRRSEAAKPEPRQGVQKAASALIFVGGVVLFFWGLFVVFVASDVLFWN